MRSAFCLVALAYLWPQTQARSMPQNAICAEAVAEAYASVTFNDSVGLDYWVGACTSRLRVASFYAASQRYCPPENLEAGYEYLSNNCQKYGEVSFLAQEDVADLLTDAAVAAMPVLDLADIANALLLTFNETIMISPAVFALEFKTVDTWEFELRTHENYGFAMYGFWGIVLGFGILQNLVTSATRRLFRSAFDFEHGQQSTKVSSLYRAFTPIGNSYRRIYQQLVMPSIFRSYHRQLVLWCSVPTRVELLVVGSYWIVSIVLCSMNYRAFEGNLYWNDIPIQVWRYVSDRCGIICYSNLALLWMFSGRNNMFQWATGWSFATFNLFHKHIGRVVTLQAILHSVGYTVYYFLEDPTGADYRSEFQETWLYMGAMATVSMSFIVLSSFAFMRVKFYESFLLVHIGLSIVIVVALFFHTSVFDGDYNPYLWPVVSIWGFDRFLRIVRLVFCNIHVALGSHRSISSTESKVSYNQEQNMLEIRLSLVSGHLMTPKPGHYFFLYQPFRWTGWESHPFTLGYWENNNKSSDSPAISSDKVDAVNGASPAKSSSLDLVFWVRPHNGWTRHLRDLCLQSPASHISPTILLEGPYGKQDNLSAYDEVLLIAGGSGIAAVVPYLLDYAKRKAVVPSKTHTTKVQVVWTDRSTDFLNSVARRELLAALTSDSVIISFYNSSVGTGTPVHASEATDSACETPTEAQETDMKITTTPKVEVNSDHETLAGLGKHYSGRPDIAAIIGETAREVGESKSSLAVLVCGPPAMADATRAATYVAMRSTKTTIDYVEHAFCW